MALCADGFERDVILAMGKTSSQALSGTKSFGDKMMFTTKLGDRGAIIAGGWYYLKRRRGESFTYKPEKSSKPKGKSKEEQKRQKEEDGKFDAKEFFGV